MARTQDLIYAAVGVGDLAVEKVTNLRKIADQDGSKLYDDFVQRGQTLYKRISQAAPTKQAISQTRTARSRARAAATSLRKAVVLNAQGPRSQAVAQTKNAQRQFKAAATSISKAVGANARATRSAVNKIAQAS